MMILQTGQMIFLDPLQDIQNNNLISVAGGGDTFAAIKKSNQQNNFTYISTAGGAFLEWLEGKMLPGLKVLEK